MHEHEKRVLEGLLFLSGDEGLSIEQLNGCVEELDKKEIEVVLDELCYISLIDKLFDSFQLLHIVLSSGLLEYKDSFYLETTNKYSVKNKKNGEI